MAINFNKYAQEGNHFVNNLAKKLGHPEEISRTGIILRAVLHTIRDRITIGESLNLMSQFPMFLKAVYVTDWKYPEEITRLTSVEEFSDAVKNYQDQYGEQEFNWGKSTEEIIRIVLSELSVYISKGEVENIMAQLPEELSHFFSETMKT